MTTTLLPQPLDTSAARKQARRVTAPAFRLLGLQPREARLEVIRRAIRKAAQEALPTRSVSEGPYTHNEWTAADNDRLVQVTTAAYRLLDPRRRSSLFERVQLLLSSEEELDTAPDSFWDQAVTSATSATPTATAPTAYSSAQPTSAATALAQPVQLRAGAASDAGSVLSERREETSAGEETQVALELFRAIRHRDRQAKVLWISIVALAASLTLALAAVTAWL